MKKEFVVIAVIHLLLVFSDIAIYKYQQSGDSPRYINAANEFIALRLSPEVHCNTAPGYPLFLALIKPVTSHNKYLIALIQSIVFCFSLYFFLSSLYRSGYLRKPLMKLSFFLILLSPEIFQTNSLTLNESLSSSLLLIAVGFCFGGWRNKISIFAFALTSTLLVLVKFEYTPVVLILFFFHAIKGNYRHIITAILILSFSMGLNGYKNYLLFGKFNPTSFGSGTVFYGGNNKNGDGSWHMWWVTNGYVPKDALTALQGMSSCIDKDSILKTLAIKAWKDNAGFQLSIIPEKLGKLWLLPASFDFYTGQTEIKRGLQISSVFNDQIYPWYGKYKHGFYLAIYWTTLALIAFGVLIKIKNMNEFDYFTLATVFAISFVYGVLFYGLGRFHVPVFPLLIIYAAIALEHARSKIISKGPD